METNAIQDWFEELVKAASQTVRQRYTVLQRVMQQGMDARLRGLGQVFPDASSKMQYLIRELRLRATADGQRLALAANAARHRMRQRGRMADGELATALPFDQKAICLFLAKVHGVDVPPALAALFPEGWREEGGQRRARDREGKVIDCLRCTLDAWDDSHLHVTLADDGRQLTVAYTRDGRYSLGDWSYLRPLFTTGAQLNLIRPREQDHVLLPELIILNPDSLISVTSVAGCFHACGTSPYWELVRKLKPREVTRHVLLGNLAGQFLDEAAYGTQATYAESVKRFFKTNALDMATCEGLDRAFHDEAMRQRDHIRATMAAHVHLGNERSLNAEEMVLEPSFFCETLGLQGRMDFIHLNMDTIVEQKSGKGAFGSAADKPIQQTQHYVQLLLYRAIFHYAYRHKGQDEISASLFYSKYPKGLLELGNAPSLLFEAVKVRNQLAWLEMHGAQKGFAFLPSLTPRKICPHASGVLWERFVRLQLEAVLAPMQAASPLERAYVLRFLRFVAHEQMLAKMGNFTKEDAGFATLWNCSTEEKRQAGCIYEQLTMDAMAANAAQEDISFTFGVEVDADTTNFRLGDIVIFYPYKCETEPSATSTIVFRGTLTQLRADGITVRLRNPQNTRVFAHYDGCLWAVEHDFMEAGFDAQYRGIYSLLSATKERRALILGQRKPAIDTAIHRCGDYAQQRSDDGGESAKNREFNDLVEHALQAQDLYLIIGPPGTGKTSFGMLNVLREHLLLPSSNILLMAYTNRAVDEMCSKLLAEGIDFIRLGSEHNCSEACRQHLLDHRVEGCNTVDDVRQLLLGTRVFCGTTTALNARTQLFALKQFDLAIIDEASQLLEPHLIGLLSARHGDDDAIKKFVLIGDEKQLPAVVQQEANVSGVEDASLQAIGLTDCRLSFFERLLKLHGRTDERFCHLLTRQGRMHPAIARFPSLSFYGDALRPVPLPHQQEPATDHRVTFISYEAFDPTDDTDKVNKAEARIIADVVRRAVTEMGGNPSVGIIVPYRNQIATVRSSFLSENSSLFTLHSSLTIDTVERFQGSERDLIVYGFTAKHPYQLDFLSANDYVADDGTIIDRKLNVAMTRARRRLVLVGNAPLLARDPVFARLIDYCKQQGCYCERAAEQ